MRIAKSSQITLRLKSADYEKLLLEAGSAREVPELIRRKLDQNSSQLKILQSIESTLDVLLRISKEHCLDSIPTEVRMKRILAGFDEDKKLDEVNEIRREIEKKLTKITNYEANYEFSTKK
ncbi:MAG: hypothetical protein EOP04_17650 [Proteobacteria bacterium]|nr:MAG: hypothetical protein EOP04_17650 [Pseudomonadota bacterium]